MQTLDTDGSSQFRVATPQQIAFFETYGFVVIRGLYLPDIENVDRAFEEVFADPETQPWEMIHEGYRFEPVSRLATWPSVTFCSMRCRLTR